jgi:hypothetical protein
MFVKPRLYHQRACDTLNGLDPIDIRHLGLDAFPRSFIIG